MDADRFDDVVRSLSAAPSRRSVLGLTLGGILGPLIGLADGAAKKRKGKRTNKKQQKKRKCLFGQRRCRDDRCHGCCSNADCGGNECALGVCRDCPRNERNCRGGCIPETNCCADGDCDGGQTCIDGACGCRSNERRCNGACISSDACCTSDDCDGAPCEGGRCLCAEGERDCNGQCIPETSCCRSSDCGPCQRCEDETCIDACPADLECVDGQCRCTTSSCDGCCDGDNCRDGDSNTFCGSGGEICDACSARQTCQGAVCTCPSGEKPCGEACIPEADCCTDSDCPSTYLCAQGTCVATCPAGADSCVTRDLTCGTLGSACTCYQSTSGETRCGQSSSIPGSHCNECDTDNDCEEFYPQIPGVFCVSNQGGLCLCPQAGQTFCQAPCPD